uniref:Uncharacterized LOC110005891 n=1 Tax=Labrus bergylta TaxID=56723 RepID=A0A3Q3GFI1_9LABR
MGNEVEVNSAISGILGAEHAQHMTNENTVSDFIVTRRRSKRSVIWRHFESLEGSSAARCRICSKKLQCFEGGTTSNLHRHMSKRHPLEFAQLFSNEQNPQPSHSSQGADAVEDTSTQPETVRALLSVSGGDSGNLNTAINADINSTINGILEAAQGGPKERFTHLELSGDHPMTRRRSKRSMIWRYFERLDILDAAQCCICMKKIQCFEGGSTSNLHRHISKRHPDVFSQLWNDGQNQSVNGDTPPEPARATRKSPCSGDVLNLSAVYTRRTTRSDCSEDLRGASEGELRVLRGERELVEALRRAQREEAQALLQQRELIKKLRAANAREAAAEREQIESLRKTQMEEAKDLSRQREALQKEKAELRKKQEELQQQS